MIKVQISEISVIFQAWEATSGGFDGYIYDDLSIVASEKGRLTVPFTTLALGEYHVKVAHLKSGPEQHLGDEIISFHYL